MMRMLWRLGAAVLLAASVARAADPAAPGVSGPGSMSKQAASGANEQPNSNRLYVEQIAFRGNRALPLRALEAVAAPYLGRDLSAADIEELRDALTHRYTEHGYMCFRAHSLHINLVGAAGFEPATLCSQSRCATRLRHAPTAAHPSTSETTRNLTQCRA